VSNFIVVSSSDPDAGAAVGSVTKHPLEALGAPFLHYLAERGSEIPFDDAHRFSLLKQSCDDGFSRSGR